MIRRVEITGAVQHAVIDVEMKLERRRIGLRAMLYARC